MHSAANNTFTLVETILIKSIINVKDPKNYIAIVVHTKSVTVDNLQEGAKNIYAKVESDSLFPIN